MSVIDFWQRKKIREVLLNDIPVNVSSDSEDIDLTLKGSLDEEEEKIETAEPTKMDLPSVRPLRKLTFIFILTYLISFITYPIVPYSLNETRPLSLQ